MAIAFNNQNNSIGIGSANSSGFTTSIVINSTGVGIGTTNPQQKLWVEGNGFFTGILTANRIFSSQYGEFVGGSISGTEIVGTALSISGISTFSNGPVLIGSATSTGTASQPLQVTGGAYVSGNTGIGTALPTSKFEVSGSSRFFTTGQGDVSITHSSLVSTIKGASTIQLALGANNTETIRINNSNQVGIGTASPAFTADIAGDARITNTNKMRFGGTSGTTNFYIQFNSTTNSLDFVAG